MNAGNMTTSPSTGWTNLKSVWRDIVQWAGRSKGLQKAHPDDLREQISACLKGRGGEVSARNRAARLARDYLGFSNAERLTFLKLLNNKFGVNQSEVSKAVKDLQASDNPELMEIQQRRLRQTLEPARLKLLRQFNMFHSGARFLVELRNELIGLHDLHPELKPLEHDIKELLAAWFDVGFLELQEITWDSPASLLEKLRRYEAVHPMRSWTDLKSRLNEDRRCFAFFHPCMENEPLIFIEVAFANALPSNIQQLLNDKRPTVDPEEASTMVFYSISNTQRGLAGISFGSFLIKQVVDRLKSELPQIRHFATLSPIPGFRRWLHRALSEKEAVIPPESRKQLLALDASESAETILQQILNNPRWHEDSKLETTLRPILLSLCSTYLLKAKRRDGKRALDPVAHFHLTNGAYMQRLNWMADKSEKGIEQSAGMMLNYVYRLERIERCHESYAGKGNIAAATRLY